MEQNVIYKDAFLQRLGISKRMCQMLAIVCAVFMFVVASGTIMLTEQVRNVWADGQALAFLLYVVTVVIGFIMTFFFLMFYIRFLCASRKNY